MEIESLIWGAELVLSGPGLQGIRTIAPSGLADNVLRLWNDNRALFPRGVDLVLTAGADFMCLPRTTKIIETEI